MATNEDEHQNNLIAAGTVFLALSKTIVDLDVQVECDPAGQPTNSMSVAVPFMKSRYRVLVQRIPGDDVGEPPHA